MIIYFYDCLYSFVCLILMVFLCNSFCERRNIGSSVIKILVCIVWFVLFNVLTLFFGEQHFALKLITTFLLHMIALSILFKTKVYKSLLILLLYFGIGICSDFVLFKLQQVIFPRTTSVDSIEQNSVSMIMGILSLLLQTIMILIIKRIANKSRYDELKTTDLLKHCIFPLFSIGVVVYLYLQKEISTGYQQILIIIMSCFLLLMNVYVFFFLRYENNRKIAQKRQVLLVNHAEELTKLYNQSCLDREEQARSAHEYKNIMFAIEGLLSAGKYQEAEAYVKARNDEIAKTANVVNTGNAVVNAVFNTKYTEAVRKGINVRFSISDLSGVQVEYTDLVTILANLLNNSIEACEKCDADRRIIDVVIKTINDKELMISIKNTYSGALSRHNGHYLTTKEDSVNHGFGLENVKSVVSRLDGYMDVDDDGEFFTVVIVITMNALDTEL